MFLLDQAGSLKIRRNLVLYARLFLNRDIALKNKFSLCYIIFSKQNGFKCTVKSNCVMKSRRYIKLLVDKVSAFVCQVYKIPIYFDPSLRLFKRYICLTASLIADWKVI